MNCYATWAVLSLLWAEKKTSLEAACDRVLDVLFQHLNEVRPTHPGFPLLCNHGIVLVLLTRLAVSQIDFSDRLSLVAGHDSLFAGVTYVVDVTECPVARPTNAEVENLIWSNKKQACTVKYERTPSQIRPFQHLSDFASRWYYFLNRADLFHSLVAVHPATGKIILCGGGVPSAHDKKIFENGDIRQSLTPGELGLGDKGYQGAEGLITPKKKSKRAKLTEEEKNANALIAKVRIIVERTIGRIKSFGCLNMRWRSAIELHHKYFTIICHLVNLSFDVRPLSKEPHPILKVTPEDQAALRQLSIVVDQ